MFDSEECCRNFIRYILYRSKAVGICWGWAILGELIAPYSRVLERAVPGLVRVLCGILSILVGILVLWLPETFGR